MTSSITTFSSQGYQKEKRQNKELKTYLKKYQQKTSLTWQRKQAYKPRKHRVPNKMNPKRPTPRHVIIKMPKVKDKERILKAREEHLQGGSHKTVN